MSAQAYREAAARLGRSIEELRLGDVEVRLLMQPEHLPQAERYLRATMRAIADFGLAYGRYPYRTLTIVDPPEEAIGTAGMEYPTFITAGTLTPFNSWPLDRVYLPEIVVAHEFAHQYFQGLVASNEFEEAWLDEGITEWATGWLVDELVGADRSFLELAGLRVGDLDYQRLANHRGRGIEMIRQPSWTYDDRLRVQRLRPAVVDAAHARRAAGPSHDGARDADLRRAVALRPSVERRLLPRRQRGRRPRPDAVLPPDDRIAGGDRLRRRRDHAGTRLHGRHGAARRATCRCRSWWRSSSPGVPSSAAPGTASARWTRFTFGYAEPLEWVDVDPDRKIALDVSWLNNGRVVAADRRAPAAMTSRWLLAVQQVLSWLAF